MEKTLLFSSFPQKNTISFVKNSLYPPYLVSTLFLKYLLRSFFLSVGDFPTKIPFFINFKQSGASSQISSLFLCIRIIYLRKNPKNPLKFHAIDFGTISYYNTYGTNSYYIFSYTFLTHPLYQTERSLL